jgi:hypothetical protein
MKKLTQTIIFFVAVNLITAGFALAQDAADEASREEAVAAQKEAEIAAKAAEKEVKNAEEKIKAAMKQVKAAQKQIELRIPKIEVAVPHIPLLGHSHSGAVLVVPAAELKPEDLAAITEDMTVMSRIFDNKLSQARLTTARGSLFVGFDPFSMHSSGTTEAIYLEGYAALFLMKVNFPLSPSPEAQEEKKTEVEDTDPLWTETKQEIYAPEEADRRRRTGDRPEEKYDAEKVEELEKTLIKTLKHATNIRTLKPDQLVILTVIGDRSQSGITTVTRSRIFRGRSTGRSSRVILPEPGAEAGSFLPTVLTICAKKSDIDAFAKGELSFDQFRELTRMFTSYAKVGKEDSPDLVHQTVAHEGHYVR